MGSSGTLNNVATTAFVWHRGVFTEVMAPGYPFSELLAFGALGSMAGNAWTTGQGVDSEGFIIDRRGDMQMIGVLPGGSFSAIQDMNLFGTAVGVGDGGGFFQSGIVYKDGTLSSVGTLPGDFAAGILAINNWGTAVGFSFGPTGPRPAISRFGGAMEDLGTMLDPATPADVALVAGLGIADSGKIVGEAFDPILYPPQFGPPGATFAVLLTPYFD